MSSPHDAQAAEMLRCWGGQFGVDVFADTATHTGEWGKIVAGGATVINALTSNWNTNPINLADGQPIYGVFTSIDLTSGAVHCYRTVNG